MKNGLYEPAAVKALLASGKKLLLAGDEDLLKALPRGTWIGGSIPYFMAEQGGVQTRDRIYVTELPGYVEGVKIAYYDERTISRVYEDMAGHGFSFILIPALSSTHAFFALKAPGFPGFASHPLIGWITGVSLDDFGRRPAKICDGSNGECLSEGAVVMHVTLPPNKVAEPNILNLFTQGRGDSIQFVQDGFAAQEAIVNGQRRPFANYIRDQRVDLRFPLVADYAGAMINTSFQGVDEATHTVNFYAPVFKGAEYRLGTMEGDYVERFRKEMPAQAGDSLVFSCNCILNYQYAGLEGKKTGSVTGPVTFGEIAYQLLNQTMVYLSITDV